MSVFNEGDSLSKVRLHLDQSVEQLEMVRRFIPGGVNSNTRLEGNFACFERAEGSKIYDIDGNEYIDYVLGMGPAILGHAPAAVLASVRESLELGQAFGGRHRLEQILAEQLATLVPSMQRVRLGVTGSEMAQVTLRLARAYTGRQRFIKFDGQYHGWFDSVLLNASSASGDVGGETRFRGEMQTAGQSVAAASDAYLLPWNDLETLEELLAAEAHNVAAIITEPMMAAVGVSPRPGFLEGVRRLCDQYGIVLIFDEVVTGFRVGLGGGQGKFGVKPDLSMFGKAMGGGFPIAAFGGRAEIMDLVGSGQVGHLGTFNANLVGVAAAVATLDILAANNGAAIAGIDALGNSIVDGIRDAALSRQSNLKVRGCGAVFHTMFMDEDDIFDPAVLKKIDQQKQRRFVDALVAKGVRPVGKGSWFVSAAHSEEDALRTVTAVSDVLDAGF